MVESGRAHNMNVPNKMNISKNYGQLYGNVWKNTIFLNHCEYFGCLFRWKWTHDGRVNVRDDAGDSGEMYSVRLLSVYR